MTDEAYWRCTVCGYIHHGGSPPDICPKCGAGADTFETMKTGGMGTDTDVDYDTFFEEDKPDK